MRNFVISAIGGGLLFFPAWSQSSVPLGSEPSPMEAFAANSGVHEAWSGEVARLRDSDTVVVITALVLQDSGQPGQKMRGVRIDLSGLAGNDRIYLDETAVQRTESALDKIATALVHFGGPPGGCEGAAEFWPLYNWAWNKYHELNAEVCGSGLVLSGRGRRQTFGLATESAASFARVLAAATEQLKQH
jgi:hypothetical protein